MRALFGSAAPTGFAAAVPADLGERGQLLSEASDRNSAKRKGPTHGVKFGEAYFGRRCTTPNMRNSE